MITFTLETVSPDDAARILEEHLAAIDSRDIVNRPVHAKTVSDYAADQLAGLWFSETAETLKFASPDRHLHGKNLIDGRHRLTACRRTGVPLTVYVARGVPREAYQYIDRPRKRSLADALHDRGEASYRELSKTLTWLQSIDRRTGRYVNGPRSTPKGLKLLEADPAIRKCVERVTAVKQERLITIGLAAALYRVFHEHDASLAEQFADAMASGASLPEGDPFWNLRRILIKNKGARKKLPQMDIYALALKAFVMKRDGRRSQFLIFKRKQEDFPVLSHDEEAPPAAEAGAETPPLNVTGAVEGRP